MSVLAVMSQIYPHWKVEKILLNPRIFKAKQCFQLDRLNILWLLVFILPFQFESQKLQIKLDDPCMCVCVYVHVYEKER